MIPTVTLVRTQQQFDNIATTFEENKSRIRPFKRQMILIVPEGTGIVTGGYKTVLVGSANGDTDWVGEIIPGKYVLLS